MGFEKGVPRHPNAGRRAGTKNKKTILRVADILAEKDINPTLEILRLIPMLELEDQAKVWLMLLSYCEAKPKENEVPEISNIQDLIEQLKDVTDSQLIKALAHKEKSKDEE